MVLLLRGKGDYEDGIMTGRVGFVIYVESRPGCKIQHSKEHFYTLGFPYKEGVSQVHKYNKEWQCNFKSIGN